MRKLLAIAILLVIGLVVLVQFGPSLVFSR